MTMRIELPKELKKKMEWKPCPFCGNTNLVISHDREKHVFNKFKCIYIGCTKCNLEVWTHDHDVGSDDYDALVRGANEKWNSREGGEKRWMKRRFFSKK